MIIQQTTTLIFQYPQDYMQEQEWCKTKDDRWIHKGTDTLGAAYENTISYSIGQPNSSEKPNNCEDLQDWKDQMWAEAIVTEPTISKMEQVDEPQIVKKYDTFCGVPMAEAIKVMQKYKTSKDEPQISDLATAIAHGAYCRTCKHLFDEDCDCDIVFTGYESMDEPQTEDGIMPEVKAGVRFDENNKTLWIKTDTVENYDRVIIEDGSNWCRIFYEECGECAHNKPRSNDEPQTDCAWK